MSSKNNKNSIADKYARKINRYVEDTNKNIQNKIISTNNKISNEIEKRNPIRLEKKPTSDRNKSFTSNPIFWLTVIPFWWVWLIIGLTQKDKNTDIKKFIKAYGKFIGVFLLIVVVWVFVSSMLRQQKIAAEESRNYYVNIDNKFSFDCEASYENEYTGITCKKRQISGTFSNYPTVEFGWSGYSFSGDKFSKEISYTINKSIYENDNFNGEKLGNNIEDSVMISLENTVLNKTVASQKVQIEYKLSPEDIALMNQKHEEWKNKKQAEENKRKEDEANRKSEEEKRKAEEQAKKSAEEQKKTQVEEPKNEEVDNGETLPSKISPYDLQALCERSFESLGYPNAKISITNHYAMGYPLYTYVIVGNLSQKQGLTSSRQQVGTSQCQVDWQAWKAKILRVNGKQIY